MAKGKTKRQISSDLFDMDKLAKATSSSVDDQIRVQQQCQVCPLAKLKAPDPPNIFADVLVISAKGVPEITSSDLGILRFEKATFHEFDVECGTKSQADDAAKACCLGRKIDLIRKVRPQLVVVIGPDLFRAIELQINKTVDPNAKPHTYHYVNWPTQLDDHKFWMLCLPEEDDWSSITDHIRDSQSLIYKALNEEPIVITSGYDTGVEFVTESKLIIPAFQDLMKYSRIACDIETSSKEASQNRAVRPYGNTAKILSVGLSVGERTFSFPILHPQTPSNFDYIEVLDQLKMLGKTKELVYHNGMFEIEWLSFFLGLDYCFEVNHGDTMALAYLLHHMSNSKALNVLIRRYFGFWLKSLSPIDVTKLDEAPIEQVLKYMGMDALWTYNLFPILYEKAREAKQLEVYHQRQIPRESSFVDMQISGMPANFEFIRTETEKQTDLKIKAQNAIFAIPEVKEVIRQRGAFDLTGKTDVPNVLRELGYQPPINAKGNETTDKIFMATVDHPFAKHLLEFRSADKILSTYLKPYHVGDAIWDDHCVHTSYNIMFTRTGRTSSDSPNLQNLPARGGKKYTRAVLAAYLYRKGMLTFEEARAFENGELVLVEIDQGQIEYRIAASISGDPVLIKAIWDDYDVHMDQAILLATTFPGKYVLNMDDPKEMKEWRGVVKNAWVFQSLYGASANSVARSFDVAENDPAFQEVFTAFWTKFAQVKRWQEQIRNEMVKNQMIWSPFGRRFLGPLTPNQVTNYPIQSSASDLLVESQVKCSRFGYENGMPWIKPRMNIHDANYWLIPKKKVDEALGIISPFMLDTFEYKDWLKVPLSIEISVGEDMGHLKEIAKLKSTDLEDVA